MNAKDSAFLRFEVLHYFNHIICFMTNAIYYIDLQLNINN